MGTGGRLNDYPHNRQHHYICNFPKQWGKLILVPTPYTQLSAKGDASLGAVGGTVYVDLLEVSFPVRIDLDWVKTNDKYSGRIGADFRWRLSTLDGSVKVWWRLLDWDFSWGKKHKHTIVKWYGLILAEESLYDVSSNWFYTL
jgi:hypothetical protein